MDKKTGIQWDKINPMIKLTILFNIFDNLTCKRLDGRFLAEMYFLYDIETHKFKSMSRQDLLTKWDEKR